jgi:hypothetical protein
MTKFPEIAYSAALDTSPAFSINSAEGNLLEEESDRLPALRPGVRGKNNHRNSRWGINRTFHFWSKVIQANFPISTTYYVPPPEAPDSCGITQETIKKPFIYRPDNRPFLICCYLRALVDTKGSY